MRDPQTNFFRAAHDRSELLEIAAAVIRKAAAGAGYPRAPPAREHCRRIGQPWDKVKGYVADGVACVGAGEEGHTGCGGGEGVARADDNNDDDRGDGTASTRGSISRTYG